MKRLGAFFLFAAAALAQTCQTVAVAGRPFNTAPFPYAASRFAVSGSQLAVTSAGKPLFSAPTQILELDGVLVNAWNPPYSANTVNWHALVPETGGTLLTIVGNQVLRLHSNGASDVVAGQTKAGYAGDGGPAVQALLNAPTALALMPDGSVLVADNGNFRIRRIMDEVEEGRTVSSARMPRRPARQPIIETIAGNGGGDPTLGNGGPAINARIGNVQSLAVLPDRSIYFAEGGFGGALKIREITTVGILMTANAIGGTSETTDNVPLANAIFTGNAVLQTGPDGLLYILDGATLRYLGNGNLHIVRVHPPSQAPANFAIAPDGSYYLLISSTIVHRLTSGSETLAAGNDYTASIDGVPAMDLAIIPSGAIVGPDGLVYFVDSGSDAILRLNADGTVHKAFQQSRAANFSYLTDYLQFARQFSFDAKGNFIFAGGGVLYQGKPDGTVTALASGGSDQTVNYSGPATKMSAFFTATRPLVMPDGSIYAVDVRRNALVRITADGNASVVWTSPGYTPPNLADFDLVDGSHISLRQDGNILASGAGGLAEIAPPNHNVVLNDNSAFSNSAGINDFFEDGSGDIVILNSSLSSLLANGDLATYNISASNWGPVQSNGLGTGGILAPDGKGNIYFVDGSHNQVAVLNNYLACMKSTTPVFTVNPYPYPLGPSYAPGMPVTVTGINLGPAATVVTQPAGNGFYPFQAGDVQLTVNGSPAAILSAQSTSLTFQIPYGLSIPATPAGSTTNSTVTVSYHGSSSTPFTFSLTPVLPALVTNGAPQLSPYTTNVFMNALIRNQDGSLNSAGNPALAGTVFSISFYGVGELNPPRQSGENPWFPMRQAAASTAVYFQNQYLTLSWAGEVPGQPGLYQLNAFAPTLSGSIELTLAVGLQTEKFFVYVTST